MSCHVWNPATLVASGRLALIVFLVSPIIFDRGCNQSGGFPTGQGALSVGPVAFRLGEIPDPRRLANGFRSIYIFVAGVRIWKFFRRVNHVTERLRRNEM